ncbi:Mediator of RNA polymerase II transcription subunit 22 [Caenorhabditis elegans]|uniref:Mediator of RNA polymerase II transcription subunit 22 n=1 Tax=Caenorhabditis elegans TaxID=6239 RepID=Q7YX22_CAEEL|nr:Mediator of RNA polymerase II transcription subunit 22 [Caenorhabditis elegans]CAE17810.2 Mediator of RNA polymerase II transcription subunit 22 [Caenorhabditis elegans]|eukprot:NP_001024627.2 Uncharacterized protein CELE_F34H10.5 [Caenorhabditis elegans]
MYEPPRQVLDYRHIEQINTVIFHFRELSRQVTMQLGVVPSSVIAELRGLNQRIVHAIELIEGDTVRNERAPFEAKLEFYHQEYEEIKVLFNELESILNNSPSLSMQ